ncbi:MAG: signal recognition particle receptor subunit alpha, partial [Phycisphaerae bacterium]
MGLFDRLRKGLSRTREKVSSGLATLLPRGRKIDDALLDDLETAMLAADMGPSTVAKLMEYIRQEWKRGRIGEAQDVVEHLKKHIIELWPDDDRGIRFTDQGPTVVLVTGINGSGKTTSVAKLAKHFTDQGRQVILGACDTFRAAAVAQLTEWSQRIGV